MERMKNYSIFLIILFVCSNFNIGFAQCNCDGSDQPEFYMHLKDNPGADYKIYAEKSGISPIYNKAFHITNSFNAEWERVDENCNPVSFYVGPDEFTSNRGCQILMLAMPVGVN